MGIEIVLYDSSPVTQKIFFHVLYHYSPVVHRVDQASALIDKIQFHSPDIIFIDSPFSEDQKFKNHMNQIREKWANIPIILMTSKEAPQAETTLARDTLQKPISAGRLRELINNFVPKTKQNILNKHLTFPPLPSFEERQGISPVLDSKLREPHAKSPLVPSPMERDKGTDQQPAMDLSSPEGEVPAIFSAEAKGKELSSDTSIGIPPATNTSIQDEGTDSVAPSGAPLMDEEAPLVNTGTGIIPVDKAENKPPINTEHEGSTQAPDGQLNKESSSATVKETALITSPLSSSITKEHIKKEARAEIEHFVKKYFKETSQAEIEHFVKKQSLDIIQKETKKVVWQVVPELARQLITKKLNQLMKEEEEDRDDPL